MPSPRRLSITPRTYRAVTVVALVLLAGIVVTGASVRLTGSGLGCTDWPRCTDETFTPSSDLHAKIEFWNRMITGLVSVAVILAVLGSVLRVPRRRDLVWLSVGLVAGVLAQIVLGGIVVLSHLNPWLVQGHFIVSMALVADATVLAHRAWLPDGATERPVVTPALHAWGRALVGLAGVVLVTGTLVTGSGPHSGENEGTPIERLPLAVHDAAQVHGITVMLFLAATIWVLVQVRRHQGPGPLLSATTLLLTVLVLQAGVGYTQYFTGVPPALVALHVLGATLVWIAVLLVLLRMRAPLAPAQSDGAQSTGAAEHADPVAHRGGVA